MDEKILIAERKRMKNFERVDKALVSINDSLNSVNHILDGNQSYSLDKLQIGFNSYTGEEAKRLARILKPELEKMQEEAQKALNDYFSCKANKEEEIK